MKSEAPTTLRTWGDFRRALAALGLLDGPPGASLAEEIGSGGIPNKPPVGPIPQRFKKLPRVRLHYGRDDYGFTDRRVLSVYWGLRKEWKEGEVAYRHWIKLSWPRLVGLEIH